MVQMHHGPSNPKVLYLYAGLRKDFYAKYQKGLVPDTQLLGLNYMEQFGIKAEFKEWALSNWLRKISFNLVHLPYLFIIRRYDVVFICAGLSLVFLAKWLLGWKKPKFVIYNTYLTNALKRHPTGLIHFINRKAIENIDLVVSTAREQMEFLLAQGFDPQKIIFHPIGIDAERFYNESKKGPAYRAPYIASVGRDLGRDYQTLFEAVKDLSVEIKVATKAETVKGLSVPSNVKLLFNVPYEEMPSFYKRALFVVTPLKNTENKAGSDTSGQYGFLEPMAAGKAVIVTDKSTVRDYIENGKEGILVPPSNAEDLKKAILTLLKDGDFRERLGRAGQQKVLKQFTSLRFAQALSDIFKSLS